MSADNPTTAKVPKLQEAESAAEGWARVITRGGRKERRPQDSIQPFDCSHSSVLTPSELRRIRLRQEQFVRALAARFSIHLRTEFGMKIGRLHTVSYQRLVDGLRSPTHLTLFKADPLKGVCLLEIPPTLALLIVDRLLGGPGQAPASPAELTEIETTLLDQAVQIVLAEWCAQWKDLQELRPLALGHENNARFLQTSPSDTPMLALSIETSVGNYSEQMQIIAPVVTLDAMLRKLGTPASVEKDAQAAPAAHPRWNRQLDNIPLKLTAAWQGLQLTARQITQLRAGEVLMMPPSASTQVKLRLAGQAKFVGQLGTCGQRWAVQITGQAKP